MSISKYRKYDQSEIVTNQGEFDPWVYILLEGELSIQVDGEEVARITRHGDLFGEMVLIDESERSATVVAETAVKCLAIDAVLLDELDLEQKGRFLGKFFRVIASLLADRLREADEELALLKKELKSSN